MRWESSGIKTLFLFNKKKTGMIGICTMTSHEIADREKKEEVSLLEFFFGYMEPATKLLSLPQDSAHTHYKFFHLCIAINGFLDRWFELKSNCYSRTLKYHDIHIHQGT